MTVGVVVLSDWSKALISLEMVGATERWSGTEGRDCPLSPAVGQTKPHHGLESRIKKAMTAIVCELRVNIVITLLILQREIPSVQKHK